jgi:hypothetical protein
MAWMAAVATSPVPARAAATTIDFQGCLTDSTGAPLQDGACAVRLSVYRGPADTDPLWQSAGLINVSISRGCFRHELGTSNPLPDSLFEYSVAWIGVAVGTGPEQVPRVLLELPRADLTDTAGQAVASGLAGAQPEPGAESPTVSPAAPTEAGSPRRLPLLYVHVGGSFGLGSMARGDIYKLIVGPFKPSVGGGYTLAISVGIRNIYQFQYRPRSVGSVNLYASDFDATIPMDIHLRDVVVHKLNLLAFKKPSRGTAPTLFACYGTAGKGKVRHVDEVSDGFLGGSDRMLGLELGVLDRTAEVSFVLERHAIEFSSFEISGLGSYSDKIEASYWYFGLQMAFGLGFAP